MIEEISIKTHSRNEFVDVTSKVEEHIKNVREGIVNVFVPHTTAAVTINENADPDVPRDIIRKLNELIPRQDDYSHAEGNSDAHIKASLFGSSKQVMVRDGKLVLGTWQSIFFCEFDGPRNRKIMIGVFNTPKNNG